MPAREDIDIVAGTSRHFAFQMGDYVDDEFIPLENLQGAVVRLTLKWRLGEVVLSSDDGGLVLDVDAAQVDWMITTEFSRTLPIGRLTQYEFEVEWSNGDQNVYLAGYIVVTRGENDD